ncbi:hypothetical protein VIOR3934_15466 [Vibrio orientalis CIP 102891 = ATCC 33934]|uniref:Uncharacterized protein n=1 Tax=Vibrio orientalis CIP 102891 = ATCC 33934 TaxID=675816 RepID=F9SZ79_VIBOR|nr:hypothetical protein VIOR3934_15466 [Vibrio orientalis CIP 102891 = ATCC 33934]
MVFLRDDSRAGILTAQSQITRYSNYAIGKKIPACPRGNFIVVLARLAYDVVRELILVVNLIP